MKVLIEELFGIFVGRVLRGHNDANGSVSERVLGSSVSGDSDGNRQSRVLTVEYDLAELSRINLFIKCVNSEVSA